MIVSNLKKTRRIAATIATLGSLAKIGAFFSSMSAMEGKTLDDVETKFAQVGAEGRCTR